MLTHTDDPDVLADLIIKLLENAALRAVLSRGGPAAAARLFDPAHNAEVLLRYYRPVLMGAAVASVATAVAT